MRELMAEEEKYLIKYCMESKENTWLALAIGQIYPKLRKKIMSSFLNELDNSVIKRLKGRDCQWQTCIPKTNPEKGGEPSIYVMTMKERGIEIHLVRYKWQALFVGTPVGQGNWPRDDLAGFLEREDLGLNTKNRHWHWWFNPAENHRSIGCIEALSKLNDDELRRKEVDYFTDDVLVCFAEAISRELGD